MPQHFLCIYGVHIDTFKFISQRIVGKVLADVIQLLRIWERSTRSDKTKKNVKNDFKCIYQTNLNC
jgi:hypothetical protein